MKNALIQLLKVKTIVTLLVVGVFSYLAIVKRIEAMDFMTVVVMILTYYFAKKDTEDKG